MVRFNRKILLSAALLLLITCLSSFFIPLPHATQVYSSTAISKSILMLGNVFGVNLFNYQISVVADITDRPTDYGGLSREILNLNLTTATSQIQGCFCFVNDTFAYCTVSPLQGSVTYVNPPPSDTLGKAKELIQRYQKSVVTSDTLQDAVNLLKGVSTIDSANKTVGTLSLEAVSGNSASDMTWNHHINGVDFPTGLQVHINGESVGLDDLSSFVRVGDANVAVDQDTATQLALDSAKLLILNMSQAGDFSQKVPAGLVEKPVSVSLIAEYREPFVEYPLWQVIFYLDKPLGHTVGVQVGVWADTGNIFYCKSVGYSFASDGQPTSSLQPQTPSSQQSSLSVTDNQLAIVILGGMAAIGFSPVMLKGKSKKFDFRFFKVAVPVLLCLLCFSMFSSVRAVNAATHVGTVWGTRLDSLGDNSLLNPPEDEARNRLCGNIATLIDSTSGWACEDFFNSSTTVSYIETANTNVNNDEDYDYMSTFHIGDFSGPGDTGYRAWDGGAPISSISDSEIRSVTGAKNHFTFLWVCTMAELYNEDGSCYNATPQAPEEADLTYINPNGIGMPYAWTHDSDMSLDGYDRPDSGSYCYIGFHDASPDLTTVGFGSSRTYEQFAMSFYNYLYGMGFSVNNALDWATKEMNDPYVTSFRNTQLYNGYDHPGMENTTEHMCTMHVFGNGNMVMPYAGNPPLSGNPDLVVGALGWNGGCYQYDVTDVYIDGLWANVTGQYGTWVVTLSLSAGVHTVAVNSQAYGGDFQYFNYYNVGENPITVDLSSSQITCVFALYYPGHTLNVTYCNSGGGTNPDPGLYQSADSFPVYACPWGNYSLDHWMLDGQNAGSSSPLSVSMNDHHTLQAVFQYGPIYYSVDSSADSRSTITPSGRTWIVQGGNQGYSISANQGYRITHVYVDTVDQGSISSYTFYDVQQAHTISVTSEVIPASYTLTVLSVDDGTSWAVPTNVYLDDNWVGEISDSSGVSFSVTAGSHYVTVDDPIETGYPDLFWWFSYFDAGSGGNPTTLSVASNLEITAHYYNEYARGMRWLQTPI